MEDSLVNQQQGQRSSKGGIRTMPFIIGNEAFQFIGGLGLTANMILYLKSNYHMEAATASSFLFLWGAMGNFLPVLGAFLSDSYYGRFQSIAWGSVINAIGSTLLWLTTIIPGAKPLACNPPQQRCETPTQSQLALLHSCFFVISIGNAGFRPCSLAFGADQFDKRDNPYNAKVIQTFFNWYYAFFGISAGIAITVIVYIQHNYGWNLGLGIPASLMAISAILFFLGSPWYVKTKAQKSLFTSLVQVMVAAFKNRHLDFPCNNEVGYYQSSNSDLVAPTNKLRFLNKASIIRNREKDIKHDGSPSNPWSLCMVDQVEDLKSLVRIMPIWSTSIILFFIMYQQQFAILQAESMDPQFGKLKFPAGSIGTFGVFSMTLWVALYDRILVPHVGRLTYKQRLGIGLLLSSVSPAVAAIVERTRRNTAIQQGLVDAGTVNMSFMWIIPQILLNGLTEGFHFIGQNEFYYSELPKSMSSIGISLFSLGIGFGNLFGDFIVNVVTRISTIGGKESWLATNLNKGHLDYYYWLLAVLAFINFLNFLLCSWAYGPCKEETIAVEKVEE